MDDLAAEKSIDPEKWRKDATIVVAALRSERRKCYRGVKKTMKASLNIKDVDTWRITIVFEKQDI